MKPLISFLFFFGLLGQLSIAQSLPHTDPEIHKMVAEVKAENLEKYVRQLASYGTRHSLSDTKSKTRGIGAAQQYVLSQFNEFAKASNGRMTASLDYYWVPADNRRIPKDSKLANVMAVLKGTDPQDDRVFIISGHLDSRASDVMNATIDAPGANDDASGVAAVMELARIMASRPFPATIIFVAVSGEEQGLLGARHLADSAKAENWNVVAMLNNDMIGNSTSSGTNLHDNTQVRIFSETIPYVESESDIRNRKYTNGDNDSDSRNLARYIKTVTQNYVEQLDIKLVYRNDRYLRGGDHTPFSQNGFAAVRYCEINENYYHQHQDVRKEEGIQYGDLPEFMDFEYARKICASNLATLASLASAPYAPQEVGIEVTELTNFSTLRWKAPAKGASPYGYQILIRETSSPHWEKAIFVKETTVTLPYSKDNYFFAVQSVDEKGNASLPEWPLPIRN
ncbi:M28 family metallopeptidase [Cytophagales bacterium LB-30]|uniref:M28 family metallopeptidase n=1 Tax=Shiella aurantiaca TaxID=3058365 RepID=A0ABT8F101_9BACT|nr:M28 family metallopeptidase [Shiella aurantiaca]MDN4164131.1 M28 family metallopeptidase [Shiella aurantiaca]